MFQGSAFSGQVAFDSGADAASISSGRGEGSQVEFSTRNARFNVGGDEKTLTGTVEFNGRTGSVSLESYMPNGRTNNFGPPTNGPAVVYRATPEYTPEAKAAKLQGSVLLALEILPSGAIDGRVRVVKGLGMGLDEKAIRVRAQVEIQSAEHRLQGRAYADSDSNQLRAAVSNPTGRAFSNPEMSLGRRFDSNTR